MIDRFQDFINRIGAHLPRGAWFLLWLGALILTGSLWWFGLIGWGWSVIPLVGFVALNMKMQMGF